MDKLRNSGQFSAKSTREDPGSSEFKQYIDQILTVEKNTARNHSLIRSLLQSNLADLHNSEPVIRLLDLIDSQDSQLR